MGSYAPTQRAELEVVRRLVLPIGVALATLLAAELSLRALGVLPNLTMTWWLRCRSCVVDDNVIIAPRAFHSDSHYQVDEDVPTIVTLGDSFTEGYPVAPDRSYPSVLRSVLSERGTRANVVNLGFGGTGPDQQLRWFLTYALPRMQPDVVVWAFYSNDLHDNIVKAVYDTDGERLIPLDASKHWLYRRRVLFDLVPLPAEAKLRSPLFRYALKSLERFGYSHVPERASKDRLGWAREKFRLELEEMQRLARERHFRAYFVSLAPQVVYMQREGDIEQADESTLYEIVKYEELCRMLVDVPGYVDGYLQDAAQLPHWRYFFDDGVRDDVPPGFRHFGEAGYAALAQLIAERLAAEHAVDAERRAAR
jgi:lysophospholipase L1-like esterase